MSKIKKLIFNISFILISLFIYGCDRGTNSETVSFVREKCASKEYCTLKLSEVTPFTWDEFYFFDKAILDQEANKILGKQIFVESVFDRGTHKLVFLKNGNVIHTEEQPTDLEVILDGQLYFSVDQSKKYGKFPKDALFEVKKLESSNGEHYKLTCTNCN